MPRVKSNWAAAYKLVSSQTSFKDTFTSSAIHYIKHSKSSSSWKEYVMTNKRRVYVKPIEITDPIETVEHGQDLENHEEVEKKSVCRLPSTPMDISCFAMIEYLTDKEKKLCSRIRVQPSVFLSIRGEINYVKEMMLSGKELAPKNRHKGYRAGESRRMRKKDIVERLNIDVNKTRMIYDSIMNIQ